MPEIIVIADTSCLIAFAKIKAIDLLKVLYSEIYITTEIAEEFGEDLPEWIKVKQLKDLNYYSILSHSLDKGEASAIALAFELKNVLLI